MRGPKKKKVKRMGKVTRAQLGEGILLSCNKMLQGGTRGEKKKKREGTSIYLEEGGVLKKVFFKKRSGKKVGGKGKKN